MREYFKEDQRSKSKLSDYLKLGESEFKDFLCEEKYRGPRTKYIMEAIGDVELDEETYKLFLRQFQRYGGRYNVRTKRETIKGIYDLLQKYPSLSASALDEIWSVYIDDQFQKYWLDEVLGKYIEIYGKTSKAFVAYIEYINETAKELDTHFYDEASKLDVYYGDYDHDLIEHLQYVIKSQHISSERIISSLPSQELITKDKDQLGEIIARTRIFFGACAPISYQMIESLATGEGLDYYPDQPKYLINGTTTIPTTFTKQQFLDSIQERLEMDKQKRKE